MHKTHFILFSFFLSCSSWAAQKSQNAVHTEGPKHGQILIRVDSGFHVNEQAPAKTVIESKGRVIKPSSIQPQLVRFDLPNNVSGKDEIKSSIYVCDNGNTVCEMREWSWGKTASATPAGGSTKGPAAKVVVKHGFYQDSLEAAASDCQKTRKPILLLFSARWCPGCMRMEKEVWTNPKLKPTLDRFAKVKLDSDRFSNKEAMKSYAVNGIPTMLILNCDKAEVERFVDYQEPAGFMISLQRIASEKTLLPRTERIAKAKAGDADAALSLARESAYSGQNAEALEFFKAVPTREQVVEYWWASVGQVEKSPAAERIPVLKKAIAAFPKTASSLEWREQLVGLLGKDTPEGKAEIQNWLTVCDQILATPESQAEFSKAEFAGDGLGFEPLKAYQSRASALELAGRADDARVAWQEAVKAGDRLGIKDVPSGPFFRFLPVLKKAQEWDRITRFFETSLKKSPKDGELLRRYGRFLFERGNFAAAAEKAKASMAASYDQNEIYAATLYAQSLEKLGQQDQARQLLLGYQARQDLPAGSRKEIEGMLAEIKPTTQSK